MIDRLAVAAGLSGDWSGHSLRRGFATAARAAGHDPLEIARAGGWVDGSRVLARYMDDVDRAKNSPWSASACEGGEGAHARHP
ncbi:MULTISPECIES: tyrosine-type recombinase/integrase [unclassified Streptomyces]|uniref:tyrosine-type recombinase/integrase n=1 Tax=unclassified Streptomyces TaxID=2593676 RepID=UPI002E761182|nr:tyrosine-type recombinase/integrase [Streptomyces sp. JV184]MEE1745826.1 tyrosine-type recombinase/integrase [Streptomyces sp. JV184]